MSVNLWENQAEPTWEDVERYARSFAYHSGIPIEGLNYRYDDEYEKYMGDETGILLLILTRDFDMPDDGHDLMMMIPIRPVSPDQAPLKINVNASSRYKFQLRRDRLYSEPELSNLAKDALLLLALSRISVYRTEDEFGREQPTNGVHFCEESPLDHTILFPARIPTQNGFDIRPIVKKLREFVSPASVYEAFSQFPSPSTPRTSTNGNGKRGRDFGDDGGMGNKRRANQARVHRAAQAFRRRVTQRPRKK